jgi:N-acetylneuraminic acid mutarotase
MKNKNIAILILALLVSCKDIREYEYPLIQTGDITDIDSTGAIFHAKIIDQSIENLQEYGFVWGLIPTPDINYSEVTFTELPENSIISKKISYDLEDDTIYYVRAFARNNSYITYGRIVSFRSMGSLSPKILDFQPQTGTGGTQITITGENFSNRISGNKVTIGQHTANINEAMNNRLIVTLPDNVNSSGYVKLSVMTARQIVSSGQKFFLQGCSIIGFKPKEVIGGDKIYIQAASFSPVVPENEIKIGGIKADIIKIIKDTIIASIPFNAKTGINDITLKVNNKINYAEEKVTVKNPWSRIMNSRTFYRNGAIGFAIGETGYVGLGLNSNSNMIYEAYNDLWKYNAVTDTWIQCADFPSAKRQNSVGFSIGNKGYVCLGQNGGSVFFNDLYEYDPAANTWTKRSNFPGKLRSSAVCTVIGNKAYIGLGTSDNMTVLYDFWEYDPSSDKWTRLADFPTETGYCGFRFASKTKGYFGLGNKNSQEPIAKNGIWEYDPLANTWTRLAAFPGSERVRSLGFTIGNYGYIGLGRKISSYYDTVLNDFWRFDINNKIWTRIPDLPYKGRWEAVGITVNNKGFIYSGNNDEDTYGYNAESIIVFSPDGK